MTSRMLLPCIGLILHTGGLMTAAPAHASDTGMDHDFTVDIDRAEQEVHVRDRITLTDGVTVVELTSRANRVEWHPTTAARELSSGHGRRRFSLTAENIDTLEVAYRLPLESADPDRTDAAGIVWDGSGPWYVDAPGTLHTFSLTVTVPSGWHSVSQGARLGSDAVGGRRRETWRETHPQQQVYLVAAPFTEYAKTWDDIQLMAFLRQPDRDLAERYLDLTGPYIHTYEQLIGAYPYAKFALVENSRETGYGMPSFTLLGPRVIRLPFIPYTSYPHEILHNWWGNSVYVDYDNGNWSEGLTAYLADHRLKAQRGEGAQYRRDALQKYLSFVSTEKDFPLSAFRARHDEASQAVGYDKSLMVFHMLRRRLGDEIFFDALGRFYRNKKFEVASFTDLRQAFEKASSEDLEGFFDQWVRRTGAPKLSLDSVTLDTEGNGFTVRGRLRQTQAGDVYELLVPVRVNAGDHSITQTLTLDKRETAFEIDLDFKPAELAVDPDFDVFRKLDAAEVPPSLGAAFGADTLSFVIPERATEAEKKAYETFITPWRGPGRTVRMLTDHSPPPASGAVWLLGWDNAERSSLLEKRLHAADVRFDGDTLRVGDRQLTRGDDAVVLAARTAHGQPLLWMHLADAEPAGTARRLAHYGRVSYVAFEKGAPVLRGQWSVRDSPLWVKLDDHE